MQPDSPLAHTSLAYALFCAGVRAQTIEDLGLCALISDDPPPAEVLRPLLETDIGSRRDDPIDALLLAACL